MKPLLLLGGGGHCRACIDVIEREGRYRVRGVLLPQGGGFEPILGYPVIGTDDDLPTLLMESPDAMVAIGQLRSAEPRKRLYGILKAAGATLPSIVSPQSYVSGRAEISEGSIVMHGAVVNAAARVGGNCIVNSMALVEHDVVIGDYCHVSTGARINGGVFVGQETFIGSGAVIREGVRIGMGVVVGAGCIVLEDIPDRAVVR